MFTKKYKTITTISITILMFVSFLLFLPTKTNALSGSEFNAGKVIDDGIFYDNGSMNAGQIQQFLNAKVPVCDTNGAQPYGGVTRAAYGASKGYSAPYTCLKNYTMTVPTKPGDSYCTGTILGGNKSSAEIIYDVAQACSVSPKVLLVLLQKEQGLVTDDWPWPVQYRSATGYGCPDTAPCDAEYYGFFNQVYQAARAFKRYRANPVNYVAGRNNSILWNPNSGCGRSDVIIENQATAGLYTYTPYRPNQAALNNLYGTGDGCSSYGNRNFWRMFNDWFGSSTETFSIDDTDINWSFEKLLGSNKGILAGADAQGGTPKSISYNGGLYVFHYNYSKGTLDVLIENGSGWQKTTIDGATGISSGSTSNRVGMYPSAAVYGNVLYVAYYDETAKDVRLSSFNGASWTSLTLDGNKNEHSIGSLDASLGERPTLIVYGSSLQLFYYDASNGNLRHAWTSASQGWKFENLDGDNFSIAHATANSGIDVTANFNPINGKLQLFYKQDGALKYAWTNTLGWHFAYLDGVSFSINEEPSNNIADPDFSFVSGNLQLFYQDSGLLKHAWGSY